MDVAELLASRENRATVDWELHLHAAYGLACLCLYLERWADFRAYEATESGAVPPTRLLRG